MQGKVDYLFAPNENEMYPKYPLKLCHVEPLSFNQIHEGQARPEFFRGVATVVTKLLNIVQPTIAYFGQKDISQCILVRRLVNDLNIPSNINVQETIRESDGLAMSSRNVYLSPEERTVANILYTALKAGLALARPGGQPIAREAIINAIESVLKQQPLVSQIEYISVASHIDMTELSTVSYDTGAVLSSAIRVGSVRLIDNLLVGRANTDILGLGSD